MSFKVLGLEACKRCGRDWVNQRVPQIQKNSFDAPSSRCVCGCVVKTYSVKSCTHCNDQQIVEIIAGPDNATLQEIPCPECTE